MTIEDAIISRHSVRQYENREIPPEIISVLQQKIDECNRKSGLHIQLVCNEPKAFDGTMAHYGKFSGITNYIALVGGKKAGFQEKCGYYGEQIVLLAQQLELNTCWVGLTFSKVASAFSIADGESLCLVIALGYGMNQGVAHKSKSLDKLCKTGATMPEWFEKGMNAVLLAPTALNQQKFLFTLKGDTVTAKAKLAFFSKVDLGIVKLHFEIGSGRVVSYL